MNSDTTTTQQVARAYFEAWTTQDSDAVRSMLADDFRFQAGDMMIEGRDAFLDAGAFPDDAMTALVTEAYQGDVGFQLYDATRGDLTVRIVEILTVRDGRLASSQFVTDMGAFMGLIER